MAQRIGRVVACLVFVVIAGNLGGSSQVRADGEKPVAPAAAVSDLQVTDLLLAVEHSGQARILWDERVAKRRVCGWRLEEIPEKELLRTAFTVLRLCGLALMPVGRGTPPTYCVVDLSAACKFNCPTCGPDEALPEEDVMVTRVVRLAHAEPRTVQAALQPLVSDPKGVLTMEDVSGVILTDFAPNVRRLERIVALMDTSAAASAAEAIPLERASAVEVVDQVQRLHGVRAPGQGPNLALRIVADRRTNKVLLCGGADGVAWAKGVVRELDAEPREQPACIHVYPLKHARAAALAAALDAVCKRLADRAAGDRPAESAGPGDANAASSGGARASGVAPCGALGVVPESESNSLIVVADAATWGAHLRPAIEALDVPPRSPVPIPAPDGK